MKKSFMSISMLIVSISMLALFVCSSVTHAQTPLKFVYDNSEKVETVYTLDKTGRLLTPKLKYEFAKEADGKSTVKTAFSWNSETQAWMPYYRLTLLETGTNAIAEYAAWDNKTKDFTGNLQKAVYSKDLNDELLSYVSYNWNQKVGSWVVNQHLLLEEYLAMNIVSLN